MSAHPHGPGAASPWVQRWSHLVAPGGTVLDIACGYGRHLHWFAQRGHMVTGVDSAHEALQTLSGLENQGRVRLVQADIENAAWPLMAGGAPQKFDAVVVTNYLWRALLPVVLDSLACGGVLLYETFASGNATVGKPSRPDFLLRARELLDLCSELRIVAFEDGFCEDPPRFVQRIAAVNRQPAGDGSADAATNPPRYPLAP